jgi:hypothetical protein
MNLLEFLGFLTLVVLVVLSSGGLSRVFGISAAVSVIPVSGVAILLLRVLTKIPIRALLILLMLLILVGLFSIGLAHALGVRQSVLVTPVAAGLAFVAIQSGRFAWRRAKTPKADPSAKTR